MIRKFDIKINDKPALGLAIPPILPWQHKVVVPGTNKVEYTQSEFCQPFESFVQPVRFILSTEIDDDGYRLPTDPLISVSGSNQIVRRYVAKSERRGSIKELWCQDDFQVTISGVIIGEEDFENIKRILTYCQAVESVKISCPLLNEAFDIQRLAIESFNFPHTKGTDNYQFTIRAYSDDNYLILDEDV